MTELEWALSEFSPKSERLKGYKKYQDYYDGNQPLAFATRKYRSQFWRLFRGFSDNMCQSVIDVQAERLEIVGFTSSAAEVDEKVIKKLEDGTDLKMSIVEDSYGDTAWENWEEENLDLLADQVHVDTFLFGDGFVIADEEGVWRQEPSEMAVRYSRERPGVLEAAAKCWKEQDGTVRLNLYLQTGLEKYASKKKYERGTGELKPLDFERLEGEDGALPQGIPVQHFSNKRYGRYGISELKSVIPLQDALNKAEMDLIISMEYQAFRQRWLTGVDVELDEETGLPKNFSGQHGPGNFLAIPDPDAKVGEFSQGDLTPYVKVINDKRGQIARVSGIPLHYFFVAETGATTSGETLKVGESRFTRKGKRQQRCLGKSWELLMDLVLEITATQVDEVDYDEEVDLNAVWDDLSPRSESEEMDVLVKKGTIGIPHSQLQREAGYDPDQIEQFAIEFKENVRSGVQAGPSKNAEGQSNVAHGETTASAVSNTGAKPATAPPVP